MTLSPVVTRSRLPFCDRPSRKMSDITHETIQGKSLSCSLSIYPLDSRRLNLPDPQPRRRLPRKESLLSQPFSLGSQGDAKASACGSRRHCRPSSGSSTWSPVLSTRLTRGCASDTAGWGEAHGRGMHPGGAACLVRHQAMSRPSPRFRSPYPSAGACVTQAVANMRSLRRWLVPRDFTHVAW